MKITDECGDQHAIITYDLTIAKPALQIQDEVSPLYDKVFIMFGAFLIQLTYFGGVGYFVSESGGLKSWLMLEYLNSRISKWIFIRMHYNTCRCKRFRPILANAMQILHFERFLNGSCELPKEFLGAYHNLNETPSPENMQHFENLPVFSEVMDKYDAFTEDTHTGKHGATARYWIMYIDLIGTFLLFSREIRTADLYLYTFCLEHMCHIFFTTNHPNYASYMVLYVLKLINIDITHPGLWEVLLSGALSVKRTNKPFSRTLVDLTLEQTVTADAASRKCGIDASTNSE